MVGALVEYDPDTVGVGGKLWTAKKVCVLARRLFSVSFTDRGMRKLLRCLEFRCQRPDRRAIEANPAAQWDWAEWAWTELSTRSASEGARIMFLDQVGVRSAGPGRRSTAADPTRGSRGASRARRLHGGNMPLRYRPIAPGTRRCAPRAAETRAEKEPAASVRSDPATSSPTSPVAPACPSGFERRPLRSCFGTVGPGISARYAIWTLAHDPELGTVSRFKFIDLLAQHEPDRAASSYIAIAYDDTRPWPVRINAAFRLETSPPRKEFKPCGLVADRLEAWFGLIADEFFPSPQLRNFSIFL
jgi:hypothetical protein